MRLPEIGDIVKFFVGADVLNKPIAAIVTDVSSNGLLTLALVMNGGGELGFRRNVRHLSDSYLKDNPERARSDGAWDWKERPTLATSPDDAIAALVTDLAKDNDFDAVFHKVKAKGITKDRLREIYKQIEAAA